MFNQKIRHRYASAMGIGMIPLEFSRELLKLWGGSLVETKADKHVCTSPKESAPLEQAMGNKVAKLESTPPEQPAEPAALGSLSMEAAITDQTPSAMKWEQPISELSASEKDPSDLGASERKD